MTQRDGSASPAASDGTPLPSTLLGKLHGLDTTAGLTDYGGLDAVVRDVHSHVYKGLPDSASVARNRAEFGENRLPHRAPRSFLSHLLEVFEDTTLRILVLAAALSIGFGAYGYLNRDVDISSPADGGSTLAELAEVIQGIAILIAIVIVSGVNSFQNWSKDREFTSLAKLKADRPVRVIRAGLEETVSIFEVVVGDLVVLASGDGLPCDGLLLRGFDLRVDQSSMTGESEPVKKLPLMASSGEEGEVTAAAPARAPRGDVILIGGCQVMEGEGVMLVTAVGRAAKIGQMVSVVENQEIGATPLQEALEELADKIGNVGMAVGILTFAVLTVMWWRANMPGGYFALIKFFIVGVSIVVVAVPEGLPLAVTISLAFSMRRMMKDNNYVRQLQACETMGSATVIASDKTGTLTENRMSVVQAWVYGKHVAGMDRLRAVINNPGAEHRLGKAIALNSNAELKRDGPRVEFIRNPSEGALLLMLWKDLGIDYEDERRAAGSLLARRAFKKETRYMTSVLPAEARGEGPIVYVKGAPENVLAMCTHTQSASGTLTPITNESRFNLRETVEAMARKGLRTLVVAYRRLPAEYNKRAKLARDACEEAWDADFASGALECDLTLLGVFGLQDPLREGVTEAVARVTAAGIRVMMVTGDHRDTASHIATQCGILRPSSGHVVMEGEHFRRLGDEERKEVCRHLAVLARSSPTDKHLLVETLKEMGEVVAVTGDGTNDAPALRAADVGLAMGIAGTDVAKEASDIIILDDRFSSIVASVCWGRSIKENIRKFLTFQLTINIVALVLTFVTACSAGGNTENFPLKPVQLLWVNLIMDSFAALALATEPPSERLMAYAPQGKTESIITRTMFKNMIGHAVVQAILLLALHFTSAGSEWFEVVHGSREHQTVVFTLFVSLQVANLFNCRSVRDEWNMFADFGESVIAQVILVIIVVMQVVIVQFGGPLAQTAPLSLEQWAKCVGVGAAVSLVVGVLLRLVPACDTELRQLAPPPMANPSGPLFADRTSVRAALERGMTDDNVGVAGDDGTDATSAAETPKHADVDTSVSAGVSEVPTAPVAPLTRQGSRKTVEGGQGLDNLIAAGSRTAKARAARGSRRRAADADGDAEEDDDDDQEEEEPRVGGARRRATRASTRRE